MYVYIVVIYQEYSHALIHVLVNNKNIDICILVLTLIMILYI